MTPDPRDARETGPTLGRAALALAGVALACGAAALVYGFPGGNNAAFALNWARGFAAAFWAGEPWPRWIAEAYGGLGAPSFVYYPPVAFWGHALTGGAPIWGEGVPWRGLAVSATVGLFLSGVAAYLWLRAIAGARAALAAAALYVAMPYHLGFELYVRNAYAELWAYVATPLVMWAGLAVAARGWRAAPHFAAALALLIATHLPTTLIAGPAAALNVLVAAERGARGRAALGLALGMALGLALAAPYWLTALTSLRHVQPEALWNAFFDPTAWLLFRDIEGYHMPRFMRQMHVAFGGVALVTAVAGGLWLVGSRPRPRLFALWAGGAAALLILTTAPAQPFWEHAPIVRRIQFPYRLFALADLAAATALAMALSGLAPARARLARGLAWVAIAPLIAGALYLGRDGIRIERGPDAPWTQAILSGSSPPEHRPRAAAQSDLGKPIAWVDHQAPVHAPAPRAVELAAGVARVEAAMLGPRRLRLEVAAETPFTLVAPRFFSPLWGVAGNPEGVALAPAEDGRLAISGPPGRHVIEIALARPPLF